MLRILLSGLALVIFHAATVSAEHPGEPKSSVGHRGYGSHKPCPYNCKLAGLPANKCRDWRTGNECYIEDFTRAPRSGPENTAANQNLNQQNTATINDQVAAVPAQNQSAGYQECKQMADLGGPSVEVEDVEKSGGIFSDKYSVRGSVEGVCLVEAGLFEDGKKIQDIPVVTGRDFRRFEFNIKASTGNKPEIRAYNINGKRDAYLVTGSK